MTAHPITREGLSDKTSTNYPVFGLKYSDRVFMAGVMAAMSAAGLDELELRDHDVPTESEMAGAEIEVTHLRTFDTSLTVKFK